jgi:trehalose 6-phosphate phosphatase
VKPWRSALLLVASRAHLHVFCDFDGTLVPVATRPEDARLSPRGASVLAALVARARTRVALVSGRPVETLASLAPVSGLIYVGNHGAERLCDGVRTEHPAATAARPAVARLARQVEALLGRLDGAEREGVAFEDKGISLSLHTKGVTEPTHEGLATEIAALAGSAPELTVFGGKRVIEVRALGAPDKGKATLALLEDAHGPGWPAQCAAFFVGDDLTDEDGFRAVCEHGAGVLVADRPLARPTAAGYLTQGVDDALSLLEALATQP